MNNDLNIQWLKSRNPLPIEPIYTLADQWRMGLFVLHVAASLSKLLCIVQCCSILFSLSDWLVSWVCGVNLNTPTKIQLQESQPSKAQNLNPDECCNILT